MPAGAAAGRTCEGGGVSGRLLNDAAVFSLVSRYDPEAAPQTRPLDALDDPRTPVDGSPRVAPRTPEAPGTPGAPGTGTASHPDHG